MDGQQHQPAQQSKDDEGDTAAAAPEGASEAPSHERGSLPASSTDAAEGSQDQDLAADAKQLLERARVSLAVSPKVLPAVEGRATWLD